MIGHYLLTLTPAQEHAVLTRPMVAGCYGLAPAGEEAGPGCLIGTALNYDEDSVERWCMGYNSIHDTSIEERFDHLVCRFGMVRISQAIRARILGNIARRTLTPQEVAV